MKKFSKKANNIFVKTCCFLLCLFLIFSLPFIKSAKNLNFERIYGAFLGEKAKNSEIIEIWNIDTFEAGDVSKTRILKNAANDFGKKYKGVYVLVRNITEQEMMNMLLAGQLPDLISCSYGVANFIKEKIVPFENERFDVYQNFLEAGKGENGEQFGVAWCCGVYFLMTTKNALEKAGVENVEEFDFAKNAFLLGYETSGKKPKKIYSISMATKGYVMPKNALIAYNANRAETLGELAYDDTLTLSQYDAYVNFLTEKSVALLGSQRDVLKLLKRVENGKLENLIVEPISKSTDLVQFMFLTDSGGHSEYAQKFVKFLTSENIQQKIAATNMFSVLKKFDYEISYFNMLENLDSFGLNNIFFSDFEK